MGVQLLADSEDDALPGLLQEPALGDIEHKAQHQDNAVFHSRVHDDAVVPLGLEQVDGIAYQNRAVEIEPGQHQDQHQADCHPPRVWLHIRKQMKQCVPFIIGFNLIFRQSAHLKSS